jgi:hypothetical protein
VRDSVCAADSQKAGLRYLADKKKEAEDEENAAALIAEVDVLEAELLDSNRNSMLRWLPSVVLCAALTVCVSQDPKASGDGRAGQ